MKWDTSTVIAVCALLFSLLSPLLTAIIQNVGESRRQKRESQQKAELLNQQFYLQHRAEVIERYIRATGAALRLQTKENVTEYGMAMGEIYLYVPKELWPKLDKMDKSIDLYNSDTPSELFAEICKDLASLEPRSPDYGLNMLVKNKKTKNVKAQ